MASAARLAAPLLLLALALQGILGASALDAAFDETTHLPSGVTYWTTGRIELNQQHPPLVKLLAALPVVAAGARSVFDPARAAEPGYEWRHGAAFLAANGRARVLLLGRLPMIALSLLLAWWVFRWARDLFGPAAGLAALTLCCFSPTVVAHGRLVTMDVPLAAFATQTAYLLWRYGRTPSRRLLVGAGLSLGLALATKFSALLLLPAAAAVLAVARLRPVAGEAPPWATGLGRAARDGAALLALAAPVVWAAYLFGDPTAYVRGALHVSADHQAGYAYYLLGEFRPGGRWLAFPVAFLVKTPAVTLGLLGLSAGVAARRWRTAPPDPVDAVALAAPAAAFALGTCALANPLGVRYLLPIYPLVFVASSSVVRLLDDRRAHRVAAAAVVLAYVGATVRTQPDQLGFFNVLVGGPSQGWRYLDDSNLDWGTDLGRLAVELRRRGVERVRLRYWGTSSPEAHGIVCDRVGVAELDRPRAAFYAISAHSLVRALQRADATGSRADWLRRYVPAGRVGSIYLFDFRGGVPAG